MLFCKIHIFFASYASFFASYASFLHQFSKNVASFDRNAFPNVISIWFKLFMELIWTLNSTLSIQDLIGFKFVDQAKQVIEFILFPSIQALTVRAKAISC